MKKTWWKEGAIYQIYPRSFCDSNGDGIGDLPGIISKLDYIKALGATMIWLSPIYVSPDFDNGYDIADYYQIDPKYGSMEDFERLLVEAHRRGLRIVMDMVLNHSSDENPWFQESRSSRDNPKRDYYIWKDPQEDGGPPNNWGQTFSADSAWTYDAATGQYFFHSFSEKQVDLNWENPVLRQELYRMMRWWCEKGVDGFRLDVIDMISKKEGYPDLPPGPNGYALPTDACCDGPHVHEYLAEMRAAVTKDYDIMLLGECPALEPEQAIRYVDEGREELDLLFQFQHVDLDCDENGKWCTRPVDLVELKANLSLWQEAINGKGWNSLYFCNHDQPRVVSRLGDDSQEHREHSAKCIATMLYFLQGTPSIYEGEELGMTNYPWTSPEEFRDIESVNAHKDLSPLYGADDAFTRIAYKSRDNARTPMPWSGNLPNAGFTTGTPWLPVNPNYVEINAADAVEREDSVFSYYKRILELRKDPAYRDLIVYGDYLMLLPDHPQIFAYLRRYEGRCLLVVCNMSRQKVDLQDLAAALEAAGLWTASAGVANPAIGSVAGVLRSSLKVAEASNPCILSNCGEKTLAELCILEPWDALVFEL